MKKIKTKKQEMFDAIKALIDEANPKSKETLKVVYIKPLNSK